MDKKQILENLKSNIYCRLKQSPIHGVGLFAIRDIPKGVNPLRGCRPINWIGFDEKELKNLDPAINKLVHDLCAMEDGKMWLPDFSLNGVDISFFINNSSENPNLEVVDSDETNGDYMYITTREIKSGEELMIDYSTYDELSKDSDKIK